MKLFRAALSYGAVYGNAMPVDVWDKVREKKAAEFAAEASGVTDEQVKSADSTWGCP
jgi:hypothetical protein